MPVVTVQMWTGRTPQQKKALVRAITDAMVTHAGAKPTNPARHHTGGPEGELGTGRRNG